MLLNPHGSDETMFPFVFKNLFKRLLNPHGSDETQNASMLFTRIAFFLTHTVQMKLVNIVFIECAVYSLLNPHGSDETLSRL